ncbi:hypothetical protein [Aquibaculum arenosum]|uniref:Uncharacterized protein n=1 Tax=Aquibaculum arenosum TaxID=3032591 RepID=A0ABT5YKN6_9PROT|nr:hypothetical protein [Fodinicurvata sp. CAU 1616]MDF2095510.1 hypothetical protein [Fodinicurvata sp. CAU 1616]
MPTALALRMTTILGSVLLLLALLFSLTLEAMHVDSERDLREGRFAYSLAQLKQRVESPLSLGLEVESLDYLQQLLEMEAAADPEILSIDLFDSEGSLLFTTDRVGIRQAVPEGWLEATLALPTPDEAEQTPQSEAIWHLDERDGQALGVALHNDFGLVVGGLVLRHSITRVGEGYLSTQNMALALPLALALGGTLIGGLLFQRLCRPVEREAAALAEALYRHQTEAKTLDSKTASNATGSLTATVTVLHSAVQAAERRCREATGEVERIDGRN